MNRRAFLNTSFKAGGVVALASLGLSPKAIANFIRGGGGGGGGTYTLGHNPAATPSSTGTAPGSFARFVASASFTAATISVYFTASSRTWMGGIYADSSGVPGALLATTSTGTTTANAWNCLALTSSESITSGTPYFLGWVVDNGISIGYGYTAGTNTRWSCADTTGTGLSDPFNGASTTARELGVYISSAAC